MRKELIDDTAKELDYDFKEIDRLLCLTDEEAGYLIANSPYLSRRETLTRKQVFDRYGVYIDYESEDEIIRHPTIPNLFGIRKGLEEWDMAAREMMGEWERFIMWGKPSKKIE